MGNVSDDLELLGIADRTRSTPERIDLLRQGLPVGAIDRLGETLALPKGRIAGYLGVSLRHLQRNRQGRLDPHQSEHLLAMAALVTQGSDYFGSREGFLDWLGSEHPALGGRPVDYLDTMTGIRFVQERLSRMAYGDLA